MHGKGGRSHAKLAAAGQPPRDESPTPTSQAAHPPRLAAPWEGVSGLLSGGPCRAGPAEPDLLRVAKLVWTSSAVGGPSVRLDIVLV